MLRVAAQRLGALGRAAPLAARPALVPLARHYADDANLLKTALYDFHIANGAKMVRDNIAATSQTRGDQTKRLPGAVIAIGDTRTIRDFIRAGSTGVACVVVTGDNDSIR